MEPQTNLALPFYHKTFRTQCSCLKSSSQIAKPIVAFAIAHLLLLHLILIEFVKVNALCGDSLFTCMQFLPVPGLMCSDPNADQICLGQCGVGDPLPIQSLLPQVLGAHCCRINGQCCCNALYFSATYEPVDGDSHPPEDDVGADSYVVANDEIKRTIDFYDDFDDGER